MAKIELLTPAQVAEEVGQPLATVLGWIERDELLAIRLAEPDGTRVSRMVLNQFLNPTPAPALPAELTRPLPWSKLVAEYESHFGVSAAELEARADRCQPPPLSTALDERMWDAWLTDLRLERSTNITPEAAPSTGVAASR